MDLKQRTLHVLRRAGVLELADGVRFRWSARHSGADRSRFREAHGEVALPPDDLAYDAYGSLHWEFYWGFGRLMAEYFAARILTLSPTGRVLEWGCGPARIVRHLPEMLGPGWEVYASDANDRTMRWCAEHVPSVRFVVNGAAPPLVLSTASFDCVYAVSVFTHLSEQMHRAWMEELRRVLKTGGLFICTLHGQSSRPLLLAAERSRFDAGRLVVRGSVTEGSRCFLAYHPDPFVRGELLKGFDIVEHVPAPNHFGARQDIWIARKH